MWSHNITYSKLDKCNNEATSETAYFHSSTATLPVPGLASNAGQEETQAETNEGVDSSNNPQRRSDDPGGLVKNSSNHSYDDNKSEACNRSYLCTADTQTAKEFSLENPIITY